MNNNSRKYTPNGGYAEVVKHSVTESGKEIITFSLKYGLIVHAELLRHKLLNHSVKSNRAIPCKTIRREVLDDPYVPIHFGSNQPGMVAKLPHPYQRLVRSVWRAARYPAVGVNWLMDKLGVHKEVCNRLLNSWQWVRQTLTATEFDNFYNLRIHQDAQKDIYVLAKSMYEAKKESSPEVLRAGEWHVPYVDTKRVYGIWEYYDNDGTQLSTEDAMKCSAARCARSSYDNHDGGKSNLQTDSKLYNTLIESEPVHASPCEHIGSPMITGPILFTEVETEANGVWEKGVTHLDRYGNFWSGNLKNWIQYRQLLSNNSCWEYDG